MMIGVWDGSTKILREVLGEICFGDGCRKLVCEWDVAGQWEALKSECGVTGLRTLLVFRKSQEMIDEGVSSRQRKRMSCCKESKDEMEKEMCCGCNSGDFLQAMMKRCVQLYQSC